MKAHLEQGSPKPAAPKSPLHQTGRHKSGFRSSLQTTRLTLQTTRLIHLAAAAPHVPQPGDPPGTSWACSSSDSPTNPPWKACSLLQHKRKKKKVNGKTSWKRGSTVNATSVMLHLSCKEKIKFCLPPETPLGKMTPSFPKWHHIVSSFQLAASLVSGPVFPGQ